jgi:hypothetical protein
LTTSLSSRISLDNGAVVQSAASPAEVAFTKGLVPSELQSQFESLRNLFASGLPAVANRSGRRGDGATPKNVPMHVAAYALHLCAANIIFLVNCEKALSK